jgi:hypothetical protein
MVCPARCRIRQMSVRVFVSVGVYGDRTTRSSNRAWRISNQRINQKLLRRVVNPNLSDFPGSAQLRMSSQVRID